MRWAEVVVWTWCLHALDVAGELVSDYNLAIIKLEFGEQLTSEWKECGKQTTTCPVAELASEVASNFKELRKDFDDRPKGTFKPEYCSEFWHNMEVKLENMRQICINEDDLPPACEQMVINTKDFMDSPRFELAILCSLIVPGENKTRVPTCGTLATATIARQKTLTECSSGFNVTRDQCIARLCDLNTRLRWRMRPYNLQMDYVLDRYPPNFVLDGCEEVQSYMFSEEECPNRVDIRGMCDCICNHMSVVTSERCAFTIDAYLLFGRQGVKGLDMSQECESALCTLFDTGSSSGACPYLLLPDEQECNAYQIPWIDTPPCEFLHHSGEDNVLVCLDGHRCNINEESWSCCYNHRGRGRCPKNLPLMCDNLCSGNPTEYCCEEAGKCNPRQCPALLLPYSVTFPSTTTGESTTPFFAEAVPQEEEGFSIRIPTGYWVWLLLIVPLLMGLVLLYCWYRARKAAMMVVHVKPINTFDEEHDKFGGWHVVRKPDVDPTKDDKQTTIVKVIVDELPSEKPLGLELQELKVIRVTPYGARWGWEEGDIIKSIGGLPVDTFEELWGRIQVERDRVPCTFEVERELHLVMAQRQADDQARQAATRSLTGSRIQSRVTSKIDGPSRVSSKIEGGSRISSKIEGGSRLSSKIEGASRISSKIEGASRISSKIERTSDLREAAGDDGQQPVYPEFTEEVDEDEVHHWWTDDWDERAETPSDALPSAVPNWRTMYRDEPEDLHVPAKLKRKPYTGPKFEEEFPVMKPVSMVEEWAAKKPKKASDPKSEVRYVKDAWGREIFRIRD
mmetsp:Transcript_95107/g.174232  ORF Transcript_95107/g.174232 Transcript_95107/m.174232 type:complete len:794 (-) Transcript_95107:66-2447(-)